MVTQGETVKVCWVTELFKLVELSIGDNPEMVGHSVVTLGERKCSQ